MSESQQLRTQIAQLVAKYAQVSMAPAAFKPGQTLVPPSGKLIGVKELQLMVEASLDGWLTTGRFNEEFESRLAKFIGVKY